MGEGVSMGQGCWAVASNLHSRWIKRLYSVFAWMDLAVLRVMVRTGTECRLRAPH